jgi:hypothetical protein
MPRDAELQHLLNENDALRAEMAQLLSEVVELRRQKWEQQSYVRELWDRNARLHCELEYFNKQVGEISAADRERLGRILRERLDAAQKRS